MHTEGSNGSITLEQYCIKIRHKGVANFLTAGLHGENTIPLTSITSIQFKSAGSWMSGFIQFSVLGGSARPAGIMEATKDQNAVLFIKEQNALFQNLKSEVERRCAELRMLPKQSAQQSDAVGELERLALLVERGFLTRADFDMRKKAILGC